MNHSEDQKQDIKKANTSSRFFTYLSYLIILLVPAYIIYQGVFHGTSRNTTTTEITSEPVSLTEPQKTATATTAFESQIAETETIHPASANTESVSTETVSIEYVSTDLASSGSADSVHDERYVIVETISTVPEKENADVSDVSNKSAGKNDVINPVLSSKSFAEIDAEVTDDQETKLIEQQRVYPGDLETTHAIKTDLAVPSTEPAIEYIKVQTIAEKVQVIDVETPTESALKAEPSTKSSSVKSDCIAISSKSFAEADSDTTLAEEKEILERQETFVSNGNNSTATECSKQSASQIGISDTEPSAVGREPLAAGREPLTSTESSIESKKGINISKSEFVYPDDIEAAGDKDKKVPAAVSVSAPEAEQPPVTEIKTAPGDWREADKSMFQPPVPQGYRRVYDPSGSVPMKRWNPPYPPSASQYRTPYQNKSYARPDRSYQYKRYKPDNYMPEKYPSNIRLPAYRGYAPENKTYYSPDAYGRPPYDYIPGSYPPANSYYRYE
jgi:hypothetical protein